MEERTTVGSSLFFWRLDEVRKLNNIVDKVTPSIHFPSCLLKGIEVSTIAKELRREGAVSVSKELAAHRDDLSSTHTQPRLHIFRTLVSTKDQMRHPSL